MLHRFSVQGEKRALGGGRKRVKARVDMEKFIFLFRESMFVVLSKRIKLKGMSVLPLTFPEILFHKPRALSFHFNPI
jgi:hypothetical protein